MKKSFTGKGAKILALRTIDKSKKPKTKKRPWCQETDAGAFCKLQE